MCDFQRCSGFFAFRWCYCCCCYGCCSPLAYLRKNPARDEDVADLASAYEQLVPALHHTLPSAWGLECPPALLTSYQSYVSSVMPAFTCRQVLPLNRGELKHVLGSQLYIIQPRSAVRVQCCSVQAAQLQRQACHLSSVHAGTLWSSRGWGVWSPTPQKA